MHILALIVALALLLPQVASAQTNQYGPRSTLPAKYRLFPGNSTGPSGNGADLTEDILTNCNWTMPANTLVNVGDEFQVKLAGKFIGSTDTKSVRYRTTNISGPIGISISATAAATIGWSLVIIYQKTASNAQNIFLLANTSGGTFNGSALSTATLVDTTANTFVVTGQNTTNSVLNSVVCQFMSTEYHGVTP